MKVWKLGLLAPLALLALLPGSSGRTLEPHKVVVQNPISAPAFTLTITGAKQGAFLGDGMSNDIRGVSYELEISALRDLATGQVSGKRQHKPIIVTKEWGPSSPQILTALTTNELLPAVQLTFTSGVNADGAILNHTISLTNAKIVAVHHHPEAGLQDGTTDKHQFEDVSFIYQKIAAHDYVGGTSFSD